MTLQGELPPVLYLPCFDFDLLPQRPQQLLWALADQGFEVVYCNVTQREAGPAFEELKPGFQVCHRLGALDRDREYLMWLTHGPYLDGLADYRLPMLISDVADDTVEEFASFQRWQQPKVARADLVFCASQPIYDKCVQLNPQTTLVRNGVNHQFFGKACSGATLPGEARVREILGDAPGPVVGFWGAVATWLDYDLIRLILEKRPKYRVVLVGPANSPKALELAERFPNLIYTGYRPHSELPAWARYFSVGIIPFAVREVTKAANPIKMYEYLASGLPVVATDLPEVRNCPLAWVARDAEEFLRGIDTVVAEGEDAAKIAARQAYAAGESWSGRAQVVAAAIRKQFFAKTKATAKPFALPKERNTEQHQLWDQVWKQTPAEWDSLSENIFQCLRGWLGDCRGKQILEVGCGSGKISARLAAQGAVVSLVDYSEKALAAAQAVFAKQELTGRFIQADMAQMPLETGSFDLVWSSGVLEHYRTAEQTEALREMARVSRNQGIVASIVMNAACLPYRIGKWFAEQNGCWPWGEEYPVVSMLEPFGAAGLVNISEATCDFMSGADFLTFLPDGQRLIRLFKTWFTQLDATEQTLFAGYLLTTKGVVH